MIVIGGPLNSGIGQHAYKYTKIFDKSTYHQIGTKIPESEHGLLFQPLLGWLQRQVLIALLP